MDKRIFLNELADIFQVEPSSFDETFRLSPDNWDSMALLATMSLIDEYFEITIPTDRLEACQSPGEVIDIISQRCLIFDRL